MSALSATTAGVGQQRLGLIRNELAHVLRRRQGLIGSDGLILLARAEGLSDHEIRSLIRSWEGRRWPSK